MLGAVEVDEGHPERAEFGDGSRNPVRRKAKCVGLVIMNRVEWNPRCVVGAWSVRSAMSDQARGGGGLDGDRVEAGDGGGTAGLGAWALSGMSTRTICVLGRFYLALVAEVRPAGATKGGVARQLPLGRRRPRLAAKYVQAGPSPQVIF